ncbi:MAG: preprotein translocase subunit SecG [Phycisphaerales bacterium JB064]
MPLVLAMSPVLSNLLMLVFIAVAVIMILIILIQRPAGGGLSGAFGASSGGSGQTAFGAKTGDALTMMTIGTFVVFILTAIVLVFSSRPPETPTAETTATPVGEQAPAESGASTSEGEPETTPAFPLEPAGDQPASDERTGDEPAVDEPADAPTGTPAEEPGDTPASDPEPELQPEPEPGS